MPDLFETNDDQVVIDPEHNYHEELVGEGKKFKDNEALARAKAESDRFILQLQKEQKEFREELNKRMTMQQVLEQLQKERGTTTPSTTGTPVTPDPTSPTDTALKETDLDKLLEQKLEQLTVRKQREQNFENVKTRLVEVFGNSASAELDKRTKELGLTREFVNRLAHESPVALYATLGINEPQRTEKTLFDTTPPRTQVTGFTPSAGPRKDYKYYQKMRRENMNSFLSAATQIEMFEQAKQQGDKFYQ